MKHMKKLKKNIVKEINVPIYGCKITYIVTYDFIKTARKYKDELCLDSNECRGLAFRLGGSRHSYMILVKPRYRKAWDTIAHEALHVANFILEDRGIKGSYKNDEAQAYLLSYIIEEIQKIK